MGTMNRLSPAKVRTAGPGMHPDGGGLYLQIVKSPGGSISRSWLYRFMSPQTRKERQMGLGSLVDVSLAEARKKAADARALKGHGVDPIEERERARQNAAAAKARAMTFDQCSDAYIAAHEASWRNAKHCQQWTNTLATYASPVLGGLPVDQVDVGMVMRALEPIWTAKPETASRLRGRIESILDWARVRGYRAGENPARWKGNLDHLLPAKGKVAKAEHHAALDYREAAAFMAGLRQREAIAARALEFTILTAARTGEVIGATWGEFDLEARLWTVPAARMKGGREHRAPLSEAAVAVLEAMPHFLNDDRAFPISNMGMPMLLRRMGRGDLTVHGFRSTFRDWAGDATTFQREVVEAALAHVVGDKAEQAYRRGDALEKRRRLMGAWADYCGAQEGAIVKLERIA
jgi:integrase